MKQKLGGYLVDILTPGEHSAHLRDAFDRHLRDMFQGQDYPSYTTAGNGTGTVVFAGPATGYVWALKKLSVQTSAATPVSVYLGESVNVPPEDTGQTSANGTSNEAVFKWTGNTSVLRDQRGVTVYASGGNILVAKLTVKQVPAERIGQL